MVQVYKGGEGVVAGTREKWPGSLSDELCLPFTHLGTPGHGIIRPHLQYVFLPHLNPLKTLKIVTSKGVFPR